VLTNHHVIDGTDDIEVVRNGKRLDVDVLIARRPPSSLRNSLPTR
jgi:S1-C subfamily serine protease